MIDVLVIKDLVANSVVKMKWVHTTHMLADILTKEMHTTDVFKSFWKVARVAPDRQRCRKRRASSTPETAAKAPQKGERKDYLE